MTDFPGVELSPRQRNDIVRGHAFSFIDQQDAVRSCV
jgi:hypothetical protein